MPRSRPSRRASASSPARPPSRARRAQRAQRALQHAVPARSRSPRAARPRPSRTAPSGNAIGARVGSCRLALAHGAELDLLFVRRAVDQPLYVDARQMDRIRIERADRHDLFHLGDADPRGGRHRRVEVARGLAEDEVARLVRLPALDDGEVGENAPLKDIGLPVELLVLLAIGDDRADAGPRVEAGDAGAAGAAALGERALRAEFHLELAGEILPLELLVLADIGGDHLLHLARAQQLA